MKKIMLVTAAVLGFTLANAQTTTTSVKTSNKAGAVSHRPTVEVKAERSALRLKDQLKLDEGQYKKVYEAKLDAMTKIEAINQKNSANIEAGKPEVTEVHGKYMTSMKGILTADQFTSWEATNKANYERYMTNSTAQPNAPKPDKDLAKIKFDLD